MYSVLYITPPQQARTVSLIMVVCQTIWWAADSGGLPRWYSCSGVERLSAGSPPAPTCKSRSGWLVVVYLPGGNVFCDPSTSTGLLMLEFTLSALGDGMLLLLVGVCWMFVLPLLAISVSLRCFSNALAL